MKFKIMLPVLLLLISTSSLAEQKTTLRLAVLAFGTVNWELAALKHEKLLDNAPYTLKITQLSNPQAGKIALQSDAVDIIVSDWIWVSRMRSNGADFTFYPYSNAAGALIVPEDSPISSVKDLPGTRLGIAGGELDKNWLLIQALGIQQHLDLNHSVNKIYAAPPLLNQQLLQHRVDAIINYWHFAARLEAKGFRQVTHSGEILKQLGINTEVPSLGYVFKHSWAENHKQAVEQFLSDTRTAKNRLCTSDTAWQHIIPMTRTQDKKTQNSLRKRYCEGRVTQWGTENLKAAKHLYSLLKKLSHNKLTGPSEFLQPETFWGFE